ncbi:MAG: hypothetical protein CMH48_01840 [Muricauda sp.]|nr:hypothetical protein [Allomuricauda sp.]
MNVQLGPKNTEIVEVDGWFVRKDIGESPRWNMRGFPITFSMRVWSKKETSELCSPNWGGGLHNRRILEMQAKAYMIMTDLLIFWSAT